MSEAAAELKKLVKQLQNTSTEVCTRSMLVVWFTDNLRVGKGIDSANLEERLPSK
jgi:hypothetical protein